jgi:hypothetical protein
MEKKSQKKPILTNKQKKNWRTILEKASRDRKFRNDLDRDFDKAIGGLGMGREDLGGFNREDVEPFEEDRFPH